MQTATRTYGRLDGAFNNAGGGWASGPVADTGTDAFRADVDLNLTSTFLCLKHEVPALLAGGGAVLTTPPTSASPACTRSAG